MNLIKRSVVAKIIAVILVACILPSGALLFLYARDNAREVNTLVEESLAKLAGEKAQVISLMMSQVEAESLSLSLFIEAELGQGTAGDKAASIADLPSGYYLDEEGTLGRAAGPGGRSSVYYPSGMQLTQAMADHLARTDALDEIFAAHIVTDTNLSTIYYITKDGLMRVYPYLDNSVFAVGHDQRQDLFYTVVSKNPEPGSFTWTRPYYDYAGQGWVMTCSRPLFEGGAFAGVLCLDMPLNKLETVFSDFRFGDNGFAFIIDAQGAIVYHPDYLSLTSKKGEALPVNFLEVSTSEGQKAIIQKMMEGQQGVGYYTDDLRKDNLVVAYQPVPGTGFDIGVQADQVTYATTLGGSSNEIILLSLFIIFSVLAAGFILSYLIARPITNLKQDVEAIIDGDYGSEARVVSSDEIGGLARTFNTMSSTIQKNMSDILERTAQLETILDSIGGLLFIVDQDYHVQLMNRRGKKIYEENGSPESPLCHALFNGDDAPCKNCPVAQAFAEGREVFGEIIAHGEVYHSFAYPVRSKDQRIRQVVVYSKQVTERILLDRELRQTEKLAGIGNLATAVTHELKNPLAVLKGALYLLPDAIHQEDKGELEEILESMGDSVERAEKIVFGLLDFSRKSSGRPEPVKIAGLLDQILLFEREGIVRNKIKVNREYAVLEDTLLCDADSLKHIFLNLISNAVQAMPQGGELTLSAERVTGDGGAGFLRFRVSDTGVGIRPEFLKQIFHPFATEGHHYQGTGLGLWIVHREITRMGGRIEVESAPGRGTTFVVEIPDGAGCQERNEDE